MKKIIFCLAAVLMLAACNNKADNQNNDSTGNESATTENTMPVASPDDEGQTEWIKQSTIMTSKPMVIDFFATWCGPCRELAPILDEIEKRHKGDVIFRRIDVDQEQELAMEFHVESIPMLMFVTPKGEYQTIVGLQEPAVIEAKIAELLTRSAK